MYSTSLSRRPMRLPSNVGVLKWGTKTIGPEKNSRIARMSCATEPASSTRTSVDMTM
jgi:hypothetical protein